MADEYELDTWRETFALFDKKGHGFVESNKIGEIMRALGSNPSQAEVAKIIGDIDPKGDKEISFEELVPFMNKHSEKKSANDFTSFCEGFKVFDRENNGMVSVAEIRYEDQFHHFDWLKIMS